MLQAIRDRAQGVFAWIIVVIICIPFALWGIQEYVGVQEQTAIAIVDGDEISQQEFLSAFYNYQYRLQQMFGENAKQLLNDEFIKQQVLQKMIEDKIIFDKSYDLGYRIGDQQVIDAIQAVAAFQTEGQFDKEKYQQHLRMQGMPTKTFEFKIRQALQSDQLRSGVKLSSFITKKELMHFLALKRQTRRFDYVTIDLEDFLSDVEVSDDEIAQYYNDNKHQYQQAMQVKLEYVLLTFDSVASRVVPEQAKLEQLYQERKEAGQYFVDEQRKVRHILIQVDDQDDQKQVSEAKAKAEKILQRLKQGENFATLSKQFSDDVTSASLGGDLGFIAKGMMVAEFEQAVFGLKNINDMTDLVKTKYGFHIIQLLEIQAASTKSFDEVKFQLTRELRKHTAEQLFYDQSQQLSDLSYENPDNLDVASEALGLEIQSSDWLTKQGGQGLFADPKVLQVAFSDDVLLEGNNSTVIELSPDRLMVLRVKEKQEAKDLPLEQVKPQIEQQLLSQKAEELITEKAKTLFQDFKKQADIEKFATEHHLILSRDQSIQRDNTELPIALVSKVFRMKKPQQDKPSYAQVTLDSGDIILIQLNQVEEAKIDQSDLENQVQLQQKLEAEQAHRDLQNMVTSFKNQADIQVNQQEIK